MSVSSRAVPFEVAGKLHHLALSTRAMLGYQREMGETIFAGVAVMEAGEVDPQRIVRIFAWMLGGKLAEAEVCDLMDAVGFAESAQLIARAVTLAFPQATVGNVPAPTESPAT